MPDTLAHTRRAIDLTRKLDAKIESLFSPLDLEMRIAQWPKQFQQLMWEAVQAKAAERARKVSE